jgi:nifR3 family TIM-barrel protein
MDVNFVYPPLRIGSLEIGFPFILAALAGYSDPPYRRICAELGAEYTLTEVILDKFLVRGGRFRRRLVRPEGEIRPVGGQIMGNDPEPMARAAAILRELRYDVIDLNFACPVRKVLARGRGGALLKQPGLALEIVRAVRQAVPDRPLTLKIRKSFAESDTAGAAFWPIAEGAFAAGIDAICVHARSVEHKYSGKADWEFLARVKRAFPNRTVIGSGDVHHAADAVRMIEAIGVDGVAVARGAIGNPWIFGQIRDLAEGRTPHRPDLAEQRALLARHYELARAHYADGHIMGLMRHFGIAYARQHPHPKEIRMAFVNMKTDDDWRAVLEAHYTEDQNKS